MTIEPILVEFNPSRILDKYDPAGRLKAYFDALRIENEKVNLVSRETLSEGLQTLAAESLLPFEQIGSSRFGSYLDIGSGGGLPAIPVLLCADVARARLLERNSKKFLALRRILRSLAVDMEAVGVEPANFEDIDILDQYELITLRLVAITGKIGRKISNILSTSGHFVYYSHLPERFSCPGLRGVTYRYQRDSSSGWKFFTIFRRTE